MKEINIAGQGVAAVEGHLTSQKHKDKVLSTNQNMICFKKAGQDKPQSTCKEPKQQSIDVNVLKQDTLKAEILWSVEVVTSIHIGHVKINQFRFHQYFLTVK